MPTGQGLAADDDEGEDPEEDSSPAISPRKGGLLTTHSGDGRGMCRGTRYARRLSSVRRGDGATPTSVMEETTLLEALGPRVRSAALQLREHGRLKERFPAKRAPHRCHAGARHSYSLPYPSQYLGARLPNRQP